MRWKHFPSLRALVALLVPGFVLILPLTLPDARGYLLTRTGLKVHCETRSIASLLPRVGRQLASVSRQIRSAAPAAVEPGVRIPSAEDWVEYGVVLEAGPPGSWDVTLRGASSPSTLIHKDGTFYLYYGGSDGSRSTDGGPRHRAIGVATSPDGIRFTKYAGNPVMTHLPYGGEEEGANSAGLLLDEGRQAVMYYGAATMCDVDNINADGRVAVSNDGFSFVDQGKVLDHRDTRLYGYGDEIFPLAAYHYEGQWYVFYLANGGTASRTVGVAWGPARDDLPHSARLLDGNDEHPAHLAANVVWARPNQLLLFVQRNWWPNVTAEVYSTDPANPTRLNGPLAVYGTPLWNEQTRFYTVFLDHERRTWFLYRSNWDEQIVLHLAPAGPVDTTPPTAPPGLTATRLENSQIALAWEAAEDQDTGVVAYRVYRDGERLGQTLEHAFVDSPAPDTSALTYAVSAVNLHGTEGPTTAIATETG